jgi:hypothetical protein
VGSIAITSPANLNITNATLETLLPEPLVSGATNITVSGIAGIVSVINGTYRINWYIPYLPEGQLTYAYYTIKNPKALPQQYSIQNIFAVPTPGPLQLSSILKVVNISVPAFYTGSINRIYVHALYTGASTGTVNFTLIGPGVKIYNSTASLTATPGQYITSSFEIATSGKPGTALLTLYVSSDGAETTYTLPVVIMSRTGISLGWSTIEEYGVLAAAAALIIISAYAIRKRGRGRRIGDGRRSELRDINEQMQGGAGGK